MSDIGCTSSAELRRRAFRASRATWPTLLLLYAVVYVLRDVSSLLTGFIGGIVGGLLSIVISLFIGVLSIGIVSGTLNYLRQGSITVRHLGSMLPFTAKMIGYGLCERLLIFLWLLPGLGLMFIGSFFLSAQHDAGVDMAGRIILGIGMLLILVLVPRASLNYTLSACCLADDPCMGGFEALERSKDMMKGNRWRFVRMVFPVILMGGVGAAITALLEPYVKGFVLSLISSALMLIPGIMEAYIVPVLYEELLIEEACAGEAADHMNEDE